MRKEDFEKFRKMDAKERAQAGIHVRSLSMTFGKIDEEARTVEVSVSSDTARVLSWIPYNGSWVVGYEVLDHSSLESIDLTRFAGENGGPALFNHDDDLLIGRFTPSGIEDGKLRGVMRIGKDPESDLYWQKIVDHVLTDTSARFCYCEDDVVLDPSSTEEGGDYPAYRVNRWALIEASLVSIPADVLVGVGRSMSAPGTAPQVEPTPQQAARSAHITGGSMDPENPNGQNDGARTQPSPAISQEAINILAIARSHGLGEDAEKLLSAKPLEEVRSELMAKIAAKPLPTPRSLEDMGASERDLKAYSYTRAMAHVLAQATGQPTQRGFEQEVSDQISKEMPTSFERKGGLLIPYALRSNKGQGERAMSLGTAGAGAELVTTQQGNLIDLLRPNMVTARFGVNTLMGLNSPVRLPKITSDPVAYWEEDLVDGKVPDSAAGTGSVSLNPRLLMSTVPVSRGLLYLSDPSAEAVIQRGITKAIALALDSACIKGTKGVLSAAGVNEVAIGVVDPATLYGLLVDMISATATANALSANSGWATTRGLAGYMSKHLEFAVNGSSKLWTGKLDDGIVAGYGAISTNQVPVAAAVHGLIFGADWSTIYQGLFGPGLEVIFDPYTGATQDLVRFTARTQADVALTQPGAFSRGTGAKLS